MVTFDKAIRLQTEELMLRPFTASDAQATFAFWSNPEMHHYSTDQPWTSLAEAEEFIRLALFLYDLKEDTFRHFFAITEKASGALTGMCGVGGIRYDRRQNEIFYHVAEPNWGKGYATEAAKAMLAYAFGQLDLDDVVGAVHPHNIASQRVMEKIGMKRKGVVERLPRDHAAYEGHYLYGLGRDEYRQNHQA